LNTAKVFLTFSVTKSTTACEKRPNQTSDLFLEQIISDQYRRRINFNCTSDNAIRFQCNVL